jgi:hypothetical protein
MKIIKLHNQQIEATKYTKEGQQVISSHNRKTSSIPFPESPNPTPHATPLKIQKLTRVKMVECQQKGLFYNCDDK